MEELINDWNHHPLSSAHNLSPRQVWHRGVARLANMDPEKACDVFCERWDDYGIDEEGPMPDIQTDNDVTIPDSCLNLPQCQLSYLQNHIHPLSEDGNEGINLYLETAEIVNDMISTGCHCQSNCSNQQNLQL